MVGSYKLATKINNLVSSGIKLETNSGKLRVSPKREKREKNDFPQDYLAKV